MRKTIKAFLLSMLLASVLHAATARWLGQADTATQVSTGVIASVDATPSNNTFSVTIGGVAVTVSGITNANTTAAALVTALQASTHPYFVAVTWSNPSGANVRGTAASGGVPFVAAISKSGAGTGTVTAFSDNTASAGPNDWSTAANWSNAGVPTSTDTVIIENSTVPILWGLGQSGVTLAELRVNQSYTGLVGLPENQFTKTVSGLAFTYDTTKSEYRDTYLKIGATLLNIGQDSATSSSAGAQRIKINTGSVQTTASLFNSCSISLDEPLTTVRWLGSHASNTWTVYQGRLGIARTLGSETATVATLTQLDGTVSLGTGVTWTHIRKTAGTLDVNSASTSGDIVNTGGTAKISVSSGTVGTITTNGGIVTLQGGFAITAQNAYGGTTYSNQTGSATTINIDQGGILDFSQSTAARTPGDISFGAGGGSLIMDGSIVIPTLITSTTAGPLTWTVKR